MYKGAFKKGGKNLINIIAWDFYFEKAQTRTAKKHSWVATPNSHDGRGYKKVMRREDGMLVFGCWNALIQLASRAYSRGILADERGIAYEIEDIAIYTNSREEWWEVAIPVFEKIGWISITSNTAVTPQSYHGDATVSPTLHDNTLHNNTDIYTSSDTLVIPQSHHGDTKMIPFTKHNTRPQLDRLWSAIPKNRQKKKGKFHDMMIEHVLQPEVSLDVVSEKLALYYESDEGKQKHHREPWTLLKDEFWDEGGELWSEDRCENKFPESAFDHHKIIKKYSDGSEEQTTNAQRMKAAGMEDSAIAYKIWLKYPEYRP